MQQKSNKEKFIRFCKVLPYNIMPLHDLAAPFSGFYVKEGQNPAIPTIVIIIVLVNIIPTGIETYLSIGNLDKLAPSLPVFGVLFAVLVLIITLQVKKKKYIRLLDEMRPEFDEAFAVASEETRRNLMIGTIKNLIILTFTAISVCLFVADALLSEEVVLGFPSWYPFDISVPTTYWILFSLQICSGLVIGVTIFAGATCFLQSMEQICMHIDNLNNQMKFRLKELGEKQNEVISDKSFDDFLCYCVSRHSTLIERVHLMDDLYSNFLLLHFVFFILIMSVSAMEFMRVTTEVTAVYALKNTMVFLTGCTELYFPSTTGSRLGIAQESVSEAVFSENIPMCSESAKRTLSIISIRAKIPVMLTIGGFKLYDVVGFTETLAAVYTIFTVLIQFR